MTQFQEMMRRARRDAQEGDWAPPPGTHTAIVVEGDAFESKAGDVYAKTTLRLVAPGEDGDGRTWDHLMGFRSPQQAAMSAGQLSVYGLSDEQLDNVEDADDLAGHMGELVGITVEVSCKSRNPDDPSDGVWTNVTSSRGHGNGDVPPDTSDWLTPAKPEQEQAEFGDAGAAPPPRSAAKHDADDVPY